MFLFTSIVIERNLESETERYNVLYAKNFDANDITYLTYARDVKKGNSSSAAK